MRRALCLPFLLLVFFQDASGVDAGSPDLFTEALVRHAEAIEVRILTEGRALTDVERTIARAAGVQHPDRVRVLRLAEVPFPDEPLVVDELRQMGVLDLLKLAGAAARGYGIIVTPRGDGRQDVIAHELVHVAQFERLGGIGPMFRAYIPDLRANGYRRADLEDEAYTRSAEILRRLP